VAAVGGRAITIFAVGFLALDGVLLGMAGWWARRWELLLTGGGLLLAAWGVLLLWQRQRRRLADITAEQAALKSAAGELRVLLRHQRGDPTSGS
jgi:hypothetical protein